MADIVVVGWDSLNVVGMNRSYHQPQLIKYTNGMPGSNRQSELIENLTYAGPQRQGAQTFHVHRYDDGVTRFNLFLIVTEPGAAACRRLCW